MAAARRKITIDQGESYNQQRQALTNGVAFDWAQWTLKAQLKAAYSDPVAVATFGVDYLADGHFNLTLSSATTLALTGSCYVWDLQATYTPDSSVKYLIRGPVAISKTVTR